MKKIKSILDIKLLLTIAFMGVSALGFSQTTEENFGNQETPPELRFDFMGTDLATHLPPQLNGWKNISENSLFPELKSAEFNHYRLDSMQDLTNYGEYIEQSKWQFNYDNSNNLITSLRQFLNLFSEYRNKTELRKYDANGQVLSLVRTERTYLNDAFVTSYKEENEYTNGNLTRQIKVQTSLDNYTKLNGQSTTTENIFTYNEKNQLTKTEKVTGEVLIRGVRTKVLKPVTAYLYDQDGRQTYYIPYLSDYPFSNRPVMYVNTMLDSTLLIKEKWGSDAEYRTPADLAKFVWHDYMTYRINLDQYGRTKSIEKTFTNSGTIIFKAKYEYTASGKLKQIALTSDNTRDLPNNYGRTIIKNTYDEQDNLLQYEKMFYNSVLNEWVDEELQTYYYSSVKSVSTSNDQHKTDNLYIYPNPASEVIHLSVSPESGTSYAIYNSIGKTVSQGTLKSQSIPVSQLKPGIYFLKTIGTNAVSNFQFIKN